MAKDTFPVRQSRLCLQKQEKNLLLSAATEDDTGVLVMAIAEHVDNPETIL